MNECISEEATKEVVELIPSTEKLKIPHFHNNMTLDEWAFAIAEVVKCSLTLEDFWRPSTMVGFKGGVVVVENVRVYIWR